MKMKLFENVSVKLASLTREFENEMTPDTYEERSLAVDPKFSNKPIEAF